jgi:hypothetical protein
LKSQDELDLISLKKIGLASIALYTPCDRIGGWCTVYNKSRVKVCTRIACCIQGFFLFISGLKHKNTVKKLQQGGKIQEECKDVTVIKV